jgi:DNA-binding NtrC family response regulator
MSRVLIVDDDAGLCHFLSRLFTRQGYEVSTGLDGPAALERLRREDFDLILLDYKMPGLSGLETLAEIRKVHCKTPVIVMTAFGTTETAIEAMKLGAYDYMLKPFDTDELKRVVADAIEVNRLMKEVVNFPRNHARIEPAGGGALEIVGAHRKMQEVFKLIGQVAEKDVNILITGESGTGKELVARAIYHHSRRQAKPFLAVNCAAIPDTLFESEVFGHERGAFTGADRVHLGKFERCDGGTIFFDEIGDMSLATQAKVLRVIQEGEFERVGGSTPIKVDARVIAATNKNLEEAVTAGEFREDLYWRLRIISIPLPPLRERLEDIPALAEHFVARFRREYGKTIRFLAESAKKKLMAYAWPGNVRELENCLRRAVILCSGEVILDEHIDIEAPETEAGAVGSGPLRRVIKGKLGEAIGELLRSSAERSRANVIELVEEILITRALEECGFNQVKAARLLGISRNTLRHRMKRYGIQTPDHE